MCFTALLVQTLQNIGGTNGFYVINLLIYDRNANITFSQFKPLRKTIKIANYWEQIHWWKKKEFDDTASIITLYCVGVIILSSVYFD